MENDLNKRHWEEMGGRYADLWANNPKQLLNFKELSFINSFLPKKETEKILDIGVGNGRILENYLNNTEVKEIYGIDISDKMVSICKDKFKDNKRIKDIIVCDFAKKNAPFDFKFDFISAIRVLKYNPNWKEMINTISELLNKEGVAVFTMPNKYSLNIFGHYAIPYYRTSKKELGNICKKNNLEVIGLQSFTRVPDVFYSLSNANNYADFIISLENLLSKILGKYLFGRMFFIAVKNGTISNNKF